MTKIEVAFVCVHNSCRSQIAEALGRLLASDVMECHSAGTERAPRINPDAVRLMHAMHGVNMEKTQYPKTLEALPPVDIVVTMGCGVECPFLPCLHREDWGLEDPTGKGDAAMAATIRSVESKVKDLADRIRAELLPARRQKS